MPSRTHRCHLSSLSGVELKLSVDRIADAALERAEERTYDAVVEIVDSEEVDHAVRDIVNSVFSRMHNELGEKSWKQNIGIRPHKIGENPPI